MEAADDACVEFHTTGATGTGSKVMGLQFDAGRPKGSKSKGQRSAAQTRGGFHLART